jgi:hypothetical protein
MRAIEKTKPPLILQEIQRRIQLGDLKPIGDTFEQYIKSDYESEQAKDKILKEAETYKSVLENGKIRTNKIIQHFLAKEQGFICCYCNNEITETHGFLEMKIEHFKPQSLFVGKSIEALKKEGKNVGHLTVSKNESKILPDLRIEYTNLLCACTGEHCDHSGKGKGDWELEYIKNPATIEKRDFKRIMQIFYTNKGYIHSENVNIQEEFGEQDKQGKLNLNAQSLVDARKTAWNILQKRIVKECGIKQNEEWIQCIKQNQPILLKYQQMYQNRKKSDDKYYPFCEFILGRLNKLIHV